MDSLPELSALIGAFYDAALDASLWTAALARARQFIGGFEAAIYAKDAASKTGDLFYREGRMTRRYHDLYFSKYVKLDPTTTGQFFAAVGEPYATADIMPYGEFLASRCYREWARPQGLVDHLAAILDKSATGFAAFGVFRHRRDGPVGERERRRMRLIVPHIRRAVLIARLFDQKAAHVQALAESTDGLRAGMFLVDADRHIVHANRAGHAMLSEGAVFRAIAGRIAANEAETDAGLAHILAAAAGGDAAIGTNGIMLPLAAADGTRYVAHVLPLASSARAQAIAARSAVAAVFVHEAALDLVSPPEAIAKAFALTPTELRVLLAIVEIGGAPETAEALGIGEETVKTHLARIFRKTATHRQADLVKLVVAYAGPVG